jgi:putative hemolysin
METPAASDAQASIPPTGAQSAQAGEAAAYCTAKGGSIESGQPTYGTNNDAAQWVPLGYPITLCKFKATDGSRIYLDLATLYSPQPTLAALAYLSKTKVPANAKGNPADALCTALGGAGNYGAGANGGGLAMADNTDDPVIAVCTFADQSFIDQWGIAYYSNGTIRGADLSALFRFDAAKAPSVF